MRILPSIVALLGIVWTGVGQDRPFDEWVHEYRAGDASRAVRSIASWSSGRLESEIAKSSGNEDVWVLAARLSLLSEAGLLNGSFGKSRSQVPSQGGDWDLASAEIGTRTAAIAIVRLQEHARSGKDPRLAEFVRRWWTVVSSLRLRTGFVLRWPPGFPSYASDDARLLMVLGTEMQSAMGPFFRDGPIAGPLPPRLFGASLIGELTTSSNGLFFNREARDAERSFRRALAREPTLAEARVRLGWVLYLLDRKKDARLELERALNDARATGDVFSVHVGGLVLGRLLERSALSAEAEAAYRAALDAEIPGHSASVGLGAFLLSSGRATEGWAELRNMLAAGAVTEPPQTDPWVGYLTGQYWRLPEMIAGLRNLVRLAPQSAAGAATPDGRQARSKPTDAPGGARNPAGSSEMAQGPVFRAATDGVRLSVQVVADGQPVVGLTADDFIVRDSGVPQRISLQPTTGHVAAAVVIDISASAAKERRVLTAAAQMFLRALDPADKAAVVAFSDRLLLHAPLASARERGADMVLSPDPSSRTAMRDAVLAGASLVAEDAARPVVIVFGDAAENASWLDALSLKNALSRSEVVVDAAWMGPDYGAAMDVSLGPLPRNEFVKTTAGAVFDAKAPDLSQQFSRRLRSLRASYVLTFTPENVKAGDGWHEVTVRLKDRKGEVHTRGGYFSGPAFAARR
jgi:VWFA-related protein